MRVAPDDDVYRVNAVWLGPRGLTFPWAARYLAYAIWLIVFMSILLIEAVTPLTMGVVPVWEFSISVLLTFALMTFVDHERPISSWRQTLAAELAAPRISPPTRASYTRPGHRWHERTPGAPRRRGANREKVQRQAREAEAMRTAEVTVEPRDESTHQVTT